LTHTAIKGGAGLMRDGVGSVEARHLGLLGLRTDQQHKDEKSDELLWSAGGRSAGHPRYFRMHQKKT